MIRKKCNNGFTLIELLIVLSIIGILVSIAIPQYQEYSAREKLKPVVIEQKIEKKQAYESENLLLQQAN